MLKGLFMTPVDFHIFTDVSKIYCGATDDVTLLAVNGGKSFHIIYN